MRLPERRGPLRFNKEVNIYAEGGTLKRFQALETDFGIVKGKISSLISESELKELQNGDKTMYSRLASAEQTVGGLTQKYTEVSSKYDTINGHYTELDSKVSGYKSTIDQLSAELIQLSSHIEKDYSTTQTMEAYVKLTTNGLKTEISESYVTQNTLNNYSTTEQMNSAIEASSTKISAEVRNTLHYNYCINGTLEENTDGWLGVVAKPGDKEIVRVEHNGKYSMFFGTLQRALAVSYSFELENDIPITIVFKIALQSTEKREDNTVNVNIDNVTVKAFPRTDFGLEWTEVTVETDITKGTHALEILPTRNSNPSGIYITDVAIYAYRSDQTAAKISVLSNSISSEVARAEKEEGKLNSRIEQTETSISARVEKNGVISAINQSAESISISASKINFNGLVSANKYFQIATDGSFTAARGKIGDFTIKDGKIYTEYATLSMRSHAFIFNGGIELRPGSGSAFSDGSDAFKIYNLNHVTSGGHLVFGNDGATVCYLSSSSKRYKDHVTNMKLDEAEKLLAVPVVWYRYKDGYLSRSDRLNGKELPGFYAEDIYEAFPEAAQLNETGEIEDWNYRVIIPVMLRLIQNLYGKKQSENTEQES